MSNIDDVLQGIDALQGKLKQLKADIQFAKNLANPNSTAQVVRKRMGRPPRNGPAIQKMNVQVPFGEAAD